MITQIIESFEIFLRNITDSSNLKTGDFVPSGGVWFWNAEEGSVEITGDEKFEYLRLLNEFSEDNEIRETFSRQAIDKLLKTCIFEVLDIAQKRRERDSQARISDAVKALKKELEGPPEQWSVALRVEGLDLGENRNWSFGSVVFRRGEDLLVDIKEKSESYYNLDEDKLVQTLSNTIYAQIKICANDFRSAVAQARNGLRSTLNVLNFYTDILNNPALHLALSDFAINRPKALDVVIAFGEDSRIGPVSYTTQGPATDFSVSLIENYREDKNFAISSLEQLLVTENLTELQHQILTGIQWVGRATIEPLREEAFILYIVGLEALLGGSEYSNVKTAILLSDGGDKFEREKKLLQELYRIRGAIVHSGRFYVAESDLAEMRLIVKESVLRLIDLVERRGFTTKAELDDWFEQVAEENDENYVAS